VKTVKSKPAVSGKNCTTVPVSSRQHSTECIW